MGYSVTPQDLYTVRRKKLLKNGGARKFYTKAGTNSGYHLLNWELNSINIPTPNEIRWHQHEVLQAHYQVYKNNFKDVIEKLSLDINGHTTTSQYDIETQEIIVMIEDFFGVWTTNDINPSSLDNIIKSYKAKELSVQRYEQLYIKGLNLYLKLSQLNYLKRGKDIKLIEQFQTLLNEINNNYQLIDSTNSRLPMNTQIVSFKKDSVLQQMRSLGYQLKGRYLEAAVHHFMNEKLSPILNLEGRDTSSDLEVHIGGSGKVTSHNKQSISDIKFFKFNGKNISIDELINQLKDAERDEQVAILKQNDINILGVQAKSAINAKPFSTGEIQLKDVKSETLDRIYKLMHEPKADFKKTDRSIGKEVYEPYFNYNLAHNLKYILGENNLLLATRDGIKFMDEYLFDMRKYIAATKGTVNVVNLEKKIKLVTRSL